MKLTPLPAYGLDYTYCENLGNGNLRHFKIPMSYQVTQDKPPVELLTDYIKTNYNCEVEFLPRPELEVPLVRNANEVLEGLGNAKKQLSLAKSGCVVQERIEYNLPLFLYPINFVTKPINYLILKLNLLIRKFNKFTKQIPYLPIVKEVLMVSACKHLSLIFDESHRSEAIEILRNDIKKLADNNLITGHFMMPYEVTLPDINGSGEKRFGLSCSLFINYEKLAKKVGVKNFNEDKYVNLLLNKYMGLKSEAWEGRFSDLVKLYTDYDIEIIDISQNSMKSDYEQYLAMHAALRSSNK
jgi:hypothetical protein